MAAAPQNIDDWLNPPKNETVNDQKRGDSPPTLKYHYPDGRYAAESLQEGFGGVVEGNADDGFVEAKLTLKIGGDQMVHLRETKYPGFGFNRPSDRCWVKLEIPDVIETIAALTKNLCTSCERRTLPGNRIAAKLVDIYGHGWILTGPGKASTSETF